MIKHAIYLLIIFIFLLIPFNFYSEVPLEYAEEALDKILQNPDYVYQTEQIEQIQNNDFSFFQEILSFLKSPAAFLVFIITILCIVTFLIFAVIYLKPFFKLHHKLKINLSQKDTFTQINYFEDALGYFISGDYKKSGTNAVTALLFYYNEQNIITLKNSLTNREYIKYLKETDESELYRKVITLSEKIVFSNSNTKENCDELLQIIKQRLA